MLKPAVDLFLHIFIPHLYLHLYPTSFFYPPHCKDLLHQKHFINKSDLTCLFSQSNTELHFLRHPKPFSSEGRWLTAGWWPRFLVLWGWHWVRQQWCCCGSSVGPRAFHWRSAGCTSRAACHCDVPDREAILKLYFCDFTCLLEPSSVAWCLQDFCFEITSFYFEPTFFLSCGADIKNLVFWWKTHLIKNIINSCVVYCNSLANLIQFQTFCFTGL